MLFRSYYGPGYGPGAIYGGIIYFRDYDGRYYRSDDGRHWRDGRGRDRDGGDRYRRGNDGRYVRDSGNSAPSTGSNDDATTVRRLLHDPNQRRADRAARQQGQGPGIVAPQQNGDGDFRERRRGNPRTQGDVPSQHTAPPRDDGDSDDDDDKRRRRRGG